MAGDQTTGSFSLFNGSKTRNTFTGLGIAVVVLAQTFSFVNGILERMQPPSQDVTLSTSLMSSINTMGQQMNDAQTRMGKAASEIHDIEVYTERLTKAIETLTTLQESGMASRRNIESDVARVLKNQKDILEDISDLKKKIVR